VRDSADSLKVCLNALEKQTYGRDKFEIIVVDNGSEVDCGPMIKADYPNIKWLYEERAGAYCARNCGLQNAGGAIIAFTDADCIPAPEWLEHAVRILKTSAATVLGGKIEFIDPIDRELNIYEIIEDEMFDMVSHQRVVETQGFAMTANLITYRAVMERIGIFDDTLLSSGDREWGQRAIAQGEVLQYAESVVIRHPRRSSFTAICKKLRRVAGGKVQLAKKRRMHSGLRPIFQQLYLRSVFNIEIYKFVWRCEKVGRPRERARLFVAMITLMLITTVEGITVALGKKPCRG
jgi:glycosyltransferase involved in cell wall biosynthesis